MQKPWIPLQIVFEDEAALEEVVVEEDEEEEESRYPSRDREGKDSWG